VGETRRDSQVLHLGKLYGLYYKHKIMTVKTINADAFTMNMTTILINDSDILNDASGFINYAPRVMPQYGTSH
jgi:hypothetical protein